MDITLIQKNQTARNTQPHSLRPCVVWGHGDFLHICFSSVGCRFREAGYCTMCDYGGGGGITAEEAVSGLKAALAHAACAVREILLGTCGSILDHREMAQPVLNAVLKAVYDSGIPTVILETHYTTVTPEILSRLQEALPGREIVMELGFESSDPWVLEHSLCKYMDLNALSDTVALIQSFGMGAVLNVFLGAPFLTPEQQLRDAENSIAWAVSHGASRAVVFPANIKPNTLLWQLYQENAYHRLSHWMLIELLWRLDDTLLEKVELSWYGDRQEAGQCTEILPPESCPECHPLLMAFYRAFMEDFDPRQRRRLLEDLRHKTHCSCKDAFLASLDKSEGAHGK
jgi:radical SAM enzyme (TIGR01210 family)